MITLLKIPTTCTTFIFFTIYTTGVPQRHFFTVDCIITTSLPLPQRSLVRSQPAARESFTRPTAKKTTLLLLLLLNKHCRAYLLLLYKTYTCRAKCRNPDGRGEPPQPSKKT
ncbi:Uncharacterized protein FWK35_00006481 [Aphis craccivora]|uniref:Uncharacterized protein n=1 Tax=Aphis craccivora TaxID=307492 RepID=A0A6G0ZB87_APHCR|nr:Uncharacterized protein FWK35_00006481 [Aphis craccivora]